MTSSLSCEAFRDDIIALLYDDGDPKERIRAREHLAQCVPCRTEYSDFKGIRKVLGGWTLPVAAALPHSPARASSSWFPASLAAAAGIVLGIGVAVAGRGFLFPASAKETVAASASVNPTAVGQSVSYNQIQDLLEQQEARHRAEIADLKQTLARVAEAAPQAGATRTISSMSPTTLETLLKASEERQARMFEARLAGLRNESELQRQYDMAQIAAGLAYIDSRTGADAARTSELMKNLVRVTAKPQDR
jgi:Putative zinc-finger